MKITGIRPLSTWDRLENLVKIINNNTTLEQTITKNTKKVPHQDMGKILDKLA